MRNSTTISRSKFEMFKSWIIRKGWVLDCPDHGGALPKSDSLERCPFWCVKGSHAWGYYCDLSIAKSLRRPHWYPIRIEEDK